MRISFEADKGKSVDERSGGPSVRKRTVTISEGIWGIFAVVAAPFVGSFLALLADRLPRGEPVLFLRSRCRNCRRGLGALELVPILSWLAQGGRCRGCNAKIGLEAPGIEIAAILVALWAAAATPGWLALATSGLGWTLLALSVIDMRHRILPDELTLPLVPAGLAVACAAPDASPAASLVGVLVGGGAAALVAVSYHRLRGREGLGWGDVKLFAASGAWVGWSPLPSLLLFAAGMALAVALALSLAGRSGRLHRASEVPFGPFIAGALWLTWLYGPLGPS